MKDLIKEGHFDTYKASPQDPGEVRAFAKNRKDMVILHDLVYRKVQLKDHDNATYQFAVPPQYRKRALELVHDEFGHLGIDRTTSLMQITSTGHIWQRISEFTFKIACVASNSNRSRVKLNSCV